MISSWIWYAFVGFFGFGLTNFLLGCIAQWTNGNTDASISAPIVVWIAMGCAGLVAGTLFTITGRGYKGITRKIHVWIPVIAGISLSFGMLTLKFGLGSEPLARGPIVAITATNSMLVALLSWFFIKERLHVVQMIGLSVIVIGLVVIGLSNGVNSSYRGVGYGLLTMLFFGITNFLLKFAGHHGANSISATAILWASSGCVGIIAISICFVSGRGLAGLITNKELIVAFIAGLFLALGMLGIKIAVTKGPAGPATAITGSNAVLVTLLDRFFFGHLPPLIKTLGMVVSLLGIVIVALGAGHKQKQSIHH